MSRECRRNAIRGLALVGAALSFLPTVSVDASAQSLTCSNPVVPAGLPFAVPPGIPAAVCSTAAAATSLTSVLNNANTVFLTNTSAFVGSPPGRPDSNAGGVWARGIGGSIDTSSVGTFTSPGLAPGLAVSVDAKSRTQFAGVQVGSDIAKLNMGNSGWNGHVGVTGGYMGAGNSNLIGNGSAHFDVPFVGVYGAVTHTSGFYADFLARYDWYSVGVTEPNVGLAGQTFNGGSTSITSSAGYYMTLPNSWFLEPSAGLVWSQASFDSLSAPGTTLTLPGTGPVAVPSGTMAFDDVHSLLGHAGARLGTTFTTQSLSLQPFVSASVWHEFAGPATSHFACTICGSGIDLSTTRVGTYGQYGVGLAGQVLNTGWLGYGRVDFRKGDNIEGWSVSAGLRYQWQDAANVGFVKAKY